MWEHLRRRLCCRHVRDGRKQTVISKDIKSLTGVRLFAALWVVLLHSESDLELISIITPLKGILDLGYLAVPLFFILSGFILSHTYFASYSLRDHAHFVYRRFARLWPVHLVATLCLIIYIGIIAAVRGHIESNPFPLEALPSELAMVRSWFSKDLVWNYPAWAIHAEWFAYLFLFPIAFLTFRNISNRLVLLFVTGVLLAGQTFLPIEQFPGKCAEIILLFLAGSALYRLRFLLQDFPGAWFANAGLLLIIVAISGVLNHSTSLIYLAFALLIFGLSYEKGWLAQFLSHRTIVYGGMISYSLYMTHAVVLKFVPAISHKLHSLHLDIKIGGDFFLIAAVVITASAFYHLVEVPCNKALRRHSPFGSDQAPQSDTSVFIGRTS